MAFASSDGFAVQDGVVVQDAVAPSYAALRPVSPVRTDGFPVYDDLSARLLTPSNPVREPVPHPDRTVAHVLATCSGYAYSTAQTVSMMMSRMGLENNRCRLIGEYVDAMFIESTAFVVQSEDGRVVILAYRGTQPANLINWMTNADVHPSKVGFHVGAGGPYDVHAGFYRNVRATRFKVAAALKRAKQGLPVTDSAEDGVAPKLNPMEVLYVTGHSLGGAMAALLSIMLRTEPDYLGEFGEAFTATYTFGQPMIGSPDLAAACNSDAFLRDNVVRYIFKRDPVPHLPPQDTGRFANYGQEYHYAERDWTNTTRHPGRQMVSGLELLGAAGDFVFRQFPWLRAVRFAYQADDHGPQHYIAALTPPGVPSEFGDYAYTEV